MGWDGVYVGFSFVDFYMRAGREGKGREGKRREGKGREGKGREGVGLVWFGLVHFGLVLVLDDRWMDGW